MNLLPKIVRGFPRNRDDRVAMPRRLCRLGAMFAMVLIVAATRGTARCEAASALLAMFQPRRPAPALNAYRLSERLPDGLRRVAVLPLAVGASADEWMRAGQEALEPLLRSELGKKAAFEMVQVSPTHLKQWTGRSHWTSDDPLPPGFLERLKRETGCEAVLFARLTLYRPYAPLQVGWNLKLVDAAQPEQIHWAVDEVFDAGQPAVVRAAKRYSADNFQSGWPLADAANTPMALMSPRRFGQYSIHALLGTLPNR